MADEFIPHVTKHDLAAAISGNKHDKGALTIIKHLDKQDLADTLAIPAPDAHPVPLRPSWEVDAMLGRDWEQLPSTFGQMADTSKAMEWGAKFEVLAHHVSCDPGGTGHTDHEAAPVSVAHAKGIAERVQYGRVHAWGLSNWQFLQDGYDYFGGPNAPNPTLAVVDMAKYEQMLTVIDEVQFAPESATRDYSWYADLSLEFEKATQRLIGAYGNMCRAYDEIMATKQKSFPGKGNRIPGKGDLVASHIYNPDDAMVEFVYSTGKSYRRYGVSPALYASLCAADDTHQFVIDHMTGCPPADPGSVPRTA